MTTVLTKDNFRDYFNQVASDSGKQDLTEIKYIEDPVEISGKDGPLSLSRCEFQELIIDKFHGARLSLKKCVIVKLSISNFTNSEMISIEDCTIEKVDISNGESEMTKIEVIGKSTEIKEIEIHGTARTTLKLYTIFFSHGRFSKVHMSFVAVGRIELSEAIIDILFSVSSVETFGIGSCDNSKINISNSKLGELWLDKCDQTPITLYRLKLGVVKAYSCRSSQFKLEDLHGGDITIAECTFRDLSVDNPHESNIRLTNSKIEDVLDLKACRMLKSLRVDDCKIDSLTVKGCYFDKEFEIDDVQMKRTFEILNSNLGSTSLTNVHFDDECTVRIIDSKITDVAFNAFNWNKDYRLVEENFTGTGHTSLVNYMIAVREAYRQLKAAYIKGNNRIEALEFQKNELNVHYRILKLRQFNSWRDFGNFLIVASNKWFSDFGQNIWKPLLYLFFVHLLLFNVLLLTNSRIGLFLSFNFPIDWDATSKGISLYFQTLVPTHHHLVRSYTDQDVSIAGFWDFMIRISAGYFIFYFISASRKYHQS